MSDLNSEDLRLCNALREAIARYEGRLVVARQAGIGYIVSTCSFLERSLNAARDIEQHVRRIGTFASLRQRQYAIALVQWSTQNSDARSRARVEAGAEAAAENAAQRAQQMSGIQIDRIRTLLDAALANGLRLINIRLRRGEWKIKIHSPRRQLTQSKFYVHASSGLHRIYCGSIEGSTFTPAEQCPLDVLQALREFNDSPERTAAAYGHATGACCFCGRALTDARSVAMGYGPICARQYGLQWGDQRAPEVRITANARLLQDALENSASQMRAHLQRSQVAPLRDIIEGRRPPRNLVARRQINFRQENLTASVPNDEDEDSHFM